MVEVTVNGLVLLQSLGPPDGAHDGADEMTISAESSSAWLGGLDARACDELWAEIYPLMRSYVTTYASR
jgi:hypothetical protein